jgi:protein-L-isoaspartate(D-aspartate) O-methyltransferase
MGTPCGSDVASVIYRDTMRMIHSRAVEEARKIRPGEERFAVQRAEMIEQQLRRRGITDGAVLAAMAALTRHEFVPEAYRQQAYSDAPLPIGEGQTISQPYIVAVMTAALRLCGTERVLEIGTGCGYQAALLSALAREIFSVECRPRLAAAAAQRLTRLGFLNVHVHCGDGTLGLPEFAPFDAILAAAGAPGVPAPLVGQLAEGGRMVLPVGGAEHQELQLIERRNGVLHTSLLEACRFVPLVGHHGWKEPPAR